MNFLAADVGGTNSRLVHAILRQEQFEILHEKTYPSKLYPDFETIVQAFIKEHKIHDPFAAACFAVAGPVKSGTASITNLPWVISETALSKALKIPDVALINDFEGIARGIPDLSTTELLELQPGSMVNPDDIHQDYVVIGAGTGLGASYVNWHNKQIKPHSSETGHTGFAPANQLQVELLSAMLRQHEYVSLEMVLSGNGLINIYHFLHDKSGLPHPELIQSQILHPDDNFDMARVITECAIEKQDPLCIQSLECFTDIYGSAAGDIILQHYPVHKLYIAGGIAPKIIHFLQQERFINAFQNKGKMFSNMQSITINVVLQDKVGLYGALRHAKNLLSGY